MTKENNTYNQFRINVPADFEDLFSHFYFAANNSTETVTKKLMPSYQTILMFNFGNKVLLHSFEDTIIEIEKCIVLGPIKKAFNYSLLPGSEILVVNFKDDAFYRFFGNASNAENLPLHPDDLLDQNCFALLWNNLAEISETDDRINCLLEFCLPYMRQRNAVAEQLANFNEPSLNPIKTIADRQNQTERSIQINHKKHLGYSAKELNRYKRFLKAIGLIQSIASNTTKIDWFEIIEECGYYDQSQLIHDFRHYINLSPSKYLKFQRDICNPRN